VKITLRQLKQLIREQVEEHMDYDEELEGDRMDMSVKQAIHYLEKYHSEAYEKAVDQGMEETLKNMLGNAKKISNLSASHAEYFLRLLVGPHIGLPNEQPSHMELHGYRRNTSPARF